VQILNKTKQTVLAQTAEVADTALSRLKGLLGRASVEPGYALVITHCRSIHMVFMKFAIDAVFVDRNDIVVGVVEGIKPFRMSPYFFRSSYVIELAPGSVKQSGTAKGDKLEFQQ